MKWFRELILEDKTLVVMWSISLLLFLFTSFCIGAMRYDLQKQKEKLHQEMNKKYEEVEK